MKNIENYKADKYTNNEEYSEIGSGIYKYKDVFVTSLRFQQEVELGEGSSSDDISQYPLEDILDEFNVYVSDFYSEENQQKNEFCVLEFCSKLLGNIEKLRSIMGKHVYNRTNKQSGEEYIELVIE